MHQVHVANIPTNERVIRCIRDRFQIICCCTGIQNIKVDKVVTRIFLHLDQRKPKSTKIATILFDSVPDIGIRGSR